MPGCWVTTMCPGNTSNFAWGSIGRRTSLQNATRNRTNTPDHPFLLNLLSCWPFKTVSHKGVLTNVFFIQGGIGSVITAVTVIEVLDIICWVIAADFTVMKAVIICQVIAAAVVILNVGQDNFLSCFQVAIVMLCRILDCDRFLFRCSVGEPKAGLLGRDKSYLIWMLDRIFST